MLSLGLSLRAVSEHIGCSVSIKGERGRKRKWLRRCAHLRLLIPLANSKAVGRAGRQKGSG
jgi:hypothetical protein